MNKDQLAAELRKQGHGRIADLLDAEPEKSEPDAAEFVQLLAEPKKKAK